MILDWGQWMPIPTKSLGDVSWESHNNPDYWLSRHWVVPALYSPDDWYENEADRLRERAPA